MIPNSVCDAIVITGATGTGKSRLAIEVAERLNGAIISADSRCVYRSMNIGTAKPAQSDRQRVPHFGIDTLEPDEAYSAGRFARDAWHWIDETRESGGVPLIVGGTGFFIQALLSPLGPEPDLDAESRTQLRDYLQGQSTLVLKSWLKRLDPERSDQLSEEGGSQRLARSLEVTLLSGRPHSWWLSQRPRTPALSAVVFCLQLSRETLYQQIDGRFERMMSEGLLDELRDLLEVHPADAPGMKSVGYAELARHLEGEIVLEDAVEEAKRNTRRFARRQLTWFRHQLPETTIWLDANRPRADLVEEIERTWSDRSGRSGSTSPSPIASVD
jgi:tRNA dimethylallyltransferase